MKKLIKIFALLFSASMFFSGCSFNGKDSVDPLPEVHHYHFVSEVEGVAASNYDSPYTEDIFLGFYCVNYPFSEYVVEIRKNAKDGEVLKKLTVKGKDIEGVGNKADGKTSYKWAEEVPEYSTFDSYVVLTKINLPVVTVEFDKENSDFIETHNFYFGCLENEEGKYFIGDTLTFIRESFNVFVFEKSVDVTERWGDIEDEEREYNFTLTVTLDGKDVGDVRDNEFESDEYVIDWRKFPYFDTSKEHSIKVCVKKLAE